MLQMWNVNHTGQACLRSLQRRKTLRISLLMLVLVEVLVVPLQLSLPLAVVGLQLLLLLQQRKRRKNPKKRVMTIWDSAYSIKWFCLVYLILVIYKSLSSAFTRSLTIPLRFRFKY